MTIYTKKVYTISKEAEIGNISKLLFSTICVIMRLYLIINYHQKDQQDALAQLAMVQIITRRKTPNFGNGLEIVHMWVL